jgi:HK97 family phage portal protein
VFRRRRDPSEQRTLSPPSLPGPTGTGVPEPSPLNATAIADAFACIRVLSDAAASIPLIAYRDTGEARQRVPTSTRVAALLKRPSPGTTLTSMIGTIMAHLNLWGNAYIGKYRQLGMITALGVIPPDQIVVELIDGEPVYTYSPPWTGGMLQTLTRADIIHVRGMSTDGLQGLSPIRQARRALALSSQLQAHAEAFFEADASPRGILRVNRFGDVGDQVTSIRDQWETRHKGSPHRIAAVAGDIEFIPVSMPLDDAQFLDQRRLSAVEVARLFRVPPWMIGADMGGSMTYSNVESQSLAFVTYSLRPWLVAIEQAITADDDLCAGNLYVEFLLDALLRADSQTRAAVYTAALNPSTGWMTRAEVRDRENLDPEDDEPPEPPPPAPAPVIVAAAPDASAV